MRRNKVGLVLLLGGMLGAVATVPARADETAEFDRTPEECIQRSRLDRTDVVDNQTILFYMYGGRIYRNHLPETCRGLNDRDPIMISDRSPSRQICANDFIDLLQGFGRSLTRGRSCRLGQFHPITPEEVEELKNLPRRPGIEATP